MNTLQEAAIKEYVNSIIKTYEDMYLDQRKKYSLDFKTEYIDTKQMGYENRLDLDRILLELETPPKAFGSEWIEEVVKGTIDYKLEVGA